MKYFLLMIVIIFTTGCSITPKYKVTIDAIKAPNLNITPDIYTIKTLDPKKNIDELKFQHYVNILDQVLNEKGYIKATKGEVARQIIYFDYSIEKVQEKRETYIEPDISFHVGLGYPYGRFYGRHSHLFWNNYYRGRYVTYHKNYIYYNRSITLLAKDLFNKELWRVDISSIGESKNLKKIIPILIKAAKPYIGTDTAEPIQLIIKDTLKNR